MFNFIAEFFELTYPLRLHIHDTEGISDAEVVFLYNEEIIEMMEIPA